MNAAFSELHAPLLFIKRNRQTHLGHCLPLLVTLMHRLNLGDLPLLQNRSLFQTICPGCLWARNNMWLLSRVQRLAGPAGDRGLLSRLVPVPPLARLAVGTGTKATYCPGAKDSRDKWPGTKACSIVVDEQKWLQQLLWVLPRE